MIAATFKNTFKNKLIGYLSCCGFTIIETLPEKVQLWKQFSGGVGVLQSGCPVICRGRFCGPAAATVDDPPISPLICMGRQYDCRELSFLCPVNSRVF